jgi:hypothetical protein
LRFAVHPLWRPRASPRSHGVPRRDVPGRVHVSVTCETTRAGEESLALAALRCNAPARRASLASERGIDLLHPTRGLVLQSPNQQTPAGSHNLAIKSRLLTHVPARILDGSLRRASHVADLEILNPDNVETSRQIRADLFNPVFPCISLACLEAGNGLFDTGPSARATLGTRQLSLKVMEPALPCRAKLRHGQQLSRRQGGRDSYTTVDADNLASVRPWNRLRECGERDMPAARAVLGHSVRLRCNNVPGPAEPYPSRLRYPDLARLPAQSPDLLRPECNDPESLIAASFAPRRLTVGAGEEACHRVSEVPQCLLLHHLATCTKPGTRCAGSGELAALLHVPGSVASAGAPPGLLFYGEVPYIPGVRAMDPQRALLQGRRVQPVTRHANTLANTSDILREVKWRSFADLNA